LTIVRWLARVRFATAAQVARKFSISERVAYRRLKAGVDARLLWHERPVAVIKGVYGATDAGAAAAASGLGGSRWNWRDYEHTLAVADLVIALEGHYTEVRTERELLAALYRRGLPAGARPHTPDAEVVLPDGTLAAVELERTAKSRDRLARILRHYARDRRYRQVWYFAPPAIHTRVLEAGRGLPFLRPLLPRRNRRGWAGGHHRCAVHRSRCGDLGGALRG
jgi:hypothetical protein